MSCRLRLSERQHRAYGCHVRLANSSRTAQVALVLRGLLRKDVALEGLTALDGTARTHHEALRSALLGFHLWHDDQLHFLDGDGCAAGTKALNRPSKPSPLVLRHAVVGCRAFRKNTRAPNVLPKPACLLHQRLHTSSGISAIRRAPRLTSSFSARAP